MTPVKFYGGPANGDQMAVENAGRTITVRGWNPALEPWLMGAGSEWPCPVEPVLRHLYVATGGSVTASVWRAGRWIVYRELYRVYRYDGPPSGRRNSLHSVTTGD